MFHISISHSWRISVPVGKFLCLRMSLLTNELFMTYQWEAMIHVSVWMSHGTHENESWQTWNESWHTWNESFEAGNEGVGKIFHWYMCHDSFIYVPWFIHICAMTHSNELVIRGRQWGRRKKVSLRWLCAMTHSYMCHDSFIYDPWFIHANESLERGNEGVERRFHFRWLWAMTHSYMCHDSFIYVPWLIHMNELFEGGNEGVGKRCIFDDFEILECVSYHLRIAYIHIWMSHTTCTYQWVAQHTHMNESRNISEWVMAYISESYHIWLSVSYHLWIANIHIWRSRATHLNGSWLWWTSRGIYEWVTAHMIKCLVSSARTYTYE